MSFVSSRLATRPPPSNAMLNFRGRRVHLAVVENIMVHRLGERQRLDQFLRVDAARRAGGDVADVVRARAAGHDAQLGKAGQKRGGVGRADFTDLEIRARRHIDVTAAEAAREIGDAAKLPRFQVAAGKSQATHESVLRGRDEEETGILVEKNIRVLGENAGLGVGLYLVGHGERVFGAFRQLFPTERFPAGGRALLGFDLECVRAARGRAASTRGSSTRRGVQAGRRRPSRPRCGTGPATRARRGRRPPPSRSLADNAFVRRSIRCSRLRTWDRSPSSMCPDQANAPAS